VIKSATRVSLVDLNFVLTWMIKRYTKLISSETRKNAIVEHLHYQIPATQLKGPKGNGEQQSEI